MKKILIATVFLFVTSVAYASTAATSFGVRPNQKSIVFSTADGSVTSSPDYASMTISTNFTMNSSLNKAGVKNVELVRVGRVVILHFPAVYATSNGSDIALTMDVAIPAGFRPTYDTAYLSVPLWDGGANALNPGKLDISTVGVVTIRRNSNNAAWGVGANNGIYTGMSVSYTTP